MVPLLASFRQIVGLMDVPRALRNEHRDQIARWEGQLQRLAELHILVLDL
ncbi:hypothetical protein [Mesorhizobium sp.]|nr:hypothetical protein [Mesorhizobium sp.]